jgi:hypothetical protein
MAAPPGHLDPEQLHIERTFAHNLSGKAKSETKHKGASDSTDTSSMRVVEFLPDSNIRVDMVSISAAEYSKWFRHRSNTPATRGQYARL